MEKIKVRYHENIYQRFLNTIQKTIPSPQTPSPQLLSSYTLVLPHELLEEAQIFLETLGTIVNLDEVGGFSPCLDFHVCYPYPSMGNSGSPKEMETPLKLIEINTNAAFMGLSQPLFVSHYLEPPLEVSHLITQLLYWVDTSLGRHLTIVDDRPTHQNLYLEFQYYQTVFQNAFDRVTIQDPAELDPDESVYYNRLTDFYLTEPNHERLRQIFLKFPRKITPNPNDYHQLANKMRLVEWCNHPALAKHIPKTYPLTSVNRDELWHQRKNLFFKATNLYGSKMSYRGESLSRKTFEELVKAQNVIAQEYVPPHQIATPHHGIMKYDLRFYFHRSKILFAVGRLYQGQVTNARTEGGGFAPIIWE
ncbi:MAG: hypothetical protein NZ480_01580 [Bdellovibrionaceae bacterium]|nr:hypothetical protein [Pseudobdellovibrionaceae bacterium]MDW8190909.1 hypothetical protein [Pseudobdellovibrionaceae bacterium]